VSGSPVQGLRVGVDIGGTKIEAVTVAPDGSVVHRLRIPTGFGADGVIESAISAVTSIADASGSRFSEFETVGVGVPGRVDAATGEVTHAINLGVEHLALGPLLAAHLGVPVRVENDVNAAALGAFHLVGQSADESMSTDSMGYLNLGTGLAAGLVLRGELWRGSRGSAGEIGHILVDPAGPLDLDGQAGGLEVVASGSGIARQWGRPGGNAVSAVLDAAATGDPQAVEIRRRLFEGVANAVRILVLTVDVDLVVIGGGISSLGERVLGGVDDVFAGWAAQSPFIASLGLAGRVRLVPSDAPVAALGAAHLGGIAWQK
jgi:glucokinase